MKILKKISIMLTSLLISIGAAHAETWNMALAYGASNFFLANSDASLIGGIQGVSRISHMIVILSGILVILIVNYNLLTGRGFIQEGFIDSIRNPKDN